MTIICVDNYNAIRVHKQHYNYVPILLSCIKFMYSYSIIIIYAYYCHILSLCTLITL